MEVTPTTLCAYGKLPLSREFLRIRCSSGAARQFREFLDDAAPFCAGADLPRDRSAQIGMAISEAGSMAVASVWPSADEGDLRPYPFAVFAVLDRGRFRGPGSWTSLTPVFRDLEAAHKTALTLPDGAAFDAHFADDRGTAPPLSEKEAAPISEHGARQIPLRAWAEGLFPGDLEAFQTSLWRIGSLPSARESGSSVRLPLAANHPLAPQVDAWLSALVAIDFLESEPLSLVVASSHARPTLSIIPGRLEPRCMAVVRGKEVPHQVDVSVYKEPASLSGFAGFRAAVADRLDDPESSLVQLRELLLARH